MIPLVPVPVGAGTLAQRLIRVDDGTGPAGQITHLAYPFAGKTLVNPTDLFYNNVCGEKSAMLFSMFDAAGFAWNKRKYSTPGDTHRPSFPKLGHQDNMHYWSRVLTESFVSSRELFNENADTDALSWEESVRLKPGKTFKSSQIGALCERTWKEQFPLLSKTHPLRKDEPDAQPFRHVVRVAFVLER